MNDSFPIFDIIFFAGVAIFLILRLRNVLGRRTGHEKPLQGDVFSRGQKKKNLSTEHGVENDKDKIIHISGSEIQNTDVFDGDGEKDAQPDTSQETGAQISEDSGVIEGLMKIRESDRGFLPEGFLEGASAAFEIIIDAFARGDEKALRPLLNDEVLDDFTTAIGQREEAGETLETNLVSLKKVEILEAGIEGKVAVITIKFVSEQINLTRDGEGEVIDGNAEYISEVTDIWTFSRNIRSRDLNWTLSETRSQN